jgi:hypothetical protein
LWKQLVTTEVSSPLTALETILDDLEAGWLDGLDESIAKSSKTDYAGFKEYYKDLPDQFILDIIDWDKVSVKNEEYRGPTDYQIEIAVQLPIQLRASVRGPHGLGKSALAAWLILWFALTRDGSDWKVVTTASAWRQLIKYLWPEVHKWSRLLRWDKIGREPFSENKELHSLKIKLRTGEAFAVASNKPETIEGAHADHILYIFDESKTIPDATWDSVEGALSTDTEVLFLCISTPGPPLGRFYDIQARKKGYHDWWVRHVKKQELFDAGRMRKDWAENRKIQWGARDDRYLNRVEGEFAANAESAIIPLYWVEMANERWYEKFENGGFGKTERISVDVGRTHDKTVWALKAGEDIADFVEKGRMDTTEIAGELKNELRADPELDVIIDIIGMGVGIFDMCREEFPYRTYSFVASEGTYFTDRTEKLKFNNTRSAAWWQLREMLNPIYNPTLALPPNDELIGELTTPTWRTMQGGRIQIETKEQIKKRIDRSTNFADTVVAAYWEGGIYGMEAA